MKNNVQINKIRGLLRNILMPFFYLPQSGNYQYFTVYNKKEKTKKTKRKTKIYSEQWHATLVMAIRLVLLQTRNLDFKSKPAANKRE